MILIIITQFNNSGCTEFGFGTQLGEKPSLGSVRTKKKLEFGASLLITK